MFSTKVALTYINSYHTEGTPIFSYGRDSPVGVVGTTLANFPAGETARVANDLPIHLEGFYRFQVTDNISITPGIIFLAAPNQNDRSNAVIGTIRTTFKF